MRSRIALEVACPKRREDQSVSRSRAFDEEEGPMDSEEPAGHGRARTRHAESSAMPPSKVGGSGQEQSFLKQNLLLRPRKSISNKHYIRAVSGVRPQA